MSSRVSTKVRLVRCPKCRQVLAELPEVQLYQCGGCGTVLQGKNRKHVNSTTEQAPQVTDSVAKSRQGDVLESISSSNKDSTTLPELESLSNKDKVRFRDGNGDTEGIREDRSILSSSPGVLSPQNGDSSAKANDLSKHVSLSQISKSTFREDIGESSRGRDFSDELPNSSELTFGLAEPEKSDEFVRELHNLPEHKYVDSVLSPEWENDDTSRICSDDRNREIQPLGVDSSSGIVSCEDETIVKNTTKSIGGSRVASRSPSKESLVSFYLMSSDSEYPDRFPTEDRRRHFGRFSSLDMSERSLAPATTVDLTEIESYYAYEGSESSYGGIRDQMRLRISKASRKNKVANIRTIETARPTNGFHGNNNISSIEPQWAPKSSSVHPNRNHHRNEGKPTETICYASGGNRTRLDVPDNISLLRTVCELKDQLSRMHFPQVRGFSYGPFPPEREIYSDARRPTGYNLQNRACLHCCPEYRRYSAQLPLHSPARVNAKRFASSEASLWGHETKPDKQRQRSGDKIVERARSMEKYFARKGHVRPVAGGAPVVICYRCSELLRLPSEFLVLKRKCHRLMCHACKEVLRFSLREGTHIVPTSDSPRQAHLRRRPARV